MTRNKVILFLGVINSILFYSQTGAGENASAASASGVNSENNTQLNFDKNFDVNLYTGTVNINIPLQKINEDNLTMNVGLNYDATGVLVNNVSGVVGQNWYLNAGGSITRKIKGMSFDELSHAPAWFPDLNINNPPQPALGLLSYQAGFFYTRNLLNQNNWNTEAHLKTVIARASSPTGGTDAFLPPNYGWKIDTEPDIFYFNFLDKSGYFFMGQDGTWKVSSKDNLKVLYNQDTDLINPVEGINYAWYYQHLLSSGYKRKSIGRLTLVDDKGFQYIFGDNDVKSMEIHLGSYYDTNILWPYVMKWNLKKVIDANGKTIFNYEYKTGEYFLTNLYNEPNFEISSSSEQQNSTTGYSSVVMTDASFFKMYKEGGYFYKPSYLKKMTSSSGTIVDFSYVEKDNIRYTDSGNALYDISGSNINYPLFNRFWLNEMLTLMTTDEIPVTNKYKHVHYLLDEVKISFNNSTVNKFKFEYSDLAPRAFLNQVIKNNEEKYQFLYNYPQNLPGYLSEKTDMWGYYNGYPTSVSTSAKYAFWENFEANKYSSRTTNNPQILYGSLQMIVWPTIGITEFVFEPHSFRHRVTNQKSMNDYAMTELFPHGGGGLRIKKIISEGKEREFFYNNSFDEMDYNISSGILMHEPLFFTRHNVYDVNLTPDPVPFGSGGTSSANGIKPKSDFFNSNVAYSTVFEKTNNGYIKYTFNDFNDFPDYYMTGLRPFNKISKKVDLSFERGQMKSKTYFDSNQNKILEKYYSYKNLSDLSSRGIDYDFFTSNWTYYGQSHPLNLGGFNGIPSPSCMNCNSKVNPYLIYYSDKVLESEITTEYFQGGRKVESLKKYYYKNPIDPSYSLIDKVEEYPSKFDLSKYKTAKYQYASDMNTSDPLFADMIAKNMVGIPLSVTKYNEAQQPISRSETIFAKNSTTNNFVLPVSARTIKTGLNDYGNDANVDTKVTYDLYDGQGHVLQYTDQSGTPTTIILGYNKSQPIAKIIGATFNYVNTNTNIGSLQDASDVDVDTASENILISLLDDLRKNAAFKDFQITTYTYDPLVGITSLTNPDGLREYYKYNSQNKKLEKVIDVDGKVIEEYKYHYKN